MGLNGIRVLFGRTGELWWDGLQKLLSDVPDIEIVWVCSSSKEVIEQTKQLQPEVLILDEEIPGSDYRELASSVHELSEETKIIIVIKPYKNVELAAHFKSRAKAYVDKDISFDELLTTIRYVARGGMVIISPTVSKAILSQLESAGKTEPRVRPEYNINLSRRELDVLKLLARRPMTNKEIAQTLFITENTVKAHLGSILEKMNVPNRYQAAALAKEVGLISNSPD